MEDLRRNSRNNESALASQPAHADHAGGFADVADADAGGGHLSFSPDDTGDGDDGGVSVGVIAGVSVVAALVASVVVLTAVAKKRPGAIYSVTHAPPATESSHRLVGTETTITFVDLFADQPPSDQLMIQEVLDGKGEIPLIVIVSVSVCGTVLLLLNIVLISCFVHKKKRKEEAEQAASAAGAAGDSKAKMGPGDPRAVSSEGKTSEL